METPLGTLGFVTVVQARYGSRRLPGKALKTIGSQTMLSHVLERALSIGAPVVVATSVNRADDAVADAAARVDGVTVYRGIEWDVLERVAEAVQQSGARHVIRITGDCPCLAPDVSRQVVAAYCQAGVGMASNDTSTSGWPDGLDTEVFSAADLYRARDATTDPRDREHVTPWLRRTVAHTVVRCDEDWRAVKLSVDTDADLKRVRSVLTAVPPGDLDWDALRRALLATTRQKVS